MSKLGHGAKTLPHHDGRVGAKSRCGSRSTPPSYRRQSAFSFNGRAKGGGSRVQIFAYDEHVPGTREVDGARRNFVSSRSTAAINPSLSPPVTSEDQDMKRSQIPYHVAQIPADCAFVSQKQKHRHRGTYYGNAATSCHVVPNRRSDSCSRVTG